MPIIMRLDRMMADRKITLNELIAMVGISGSNLSRLKNGRVKEIRLDTLEAICEALECMPGDLIDYQKD